MLFGERWAIEGGPSPKGLDSIPLLFPPILPPLSLSLAHVHAHMVQHTTGVDLRAPLLPAYTFNYGTFTPTAVSHPSTAYGMISYHHRHQLLRPDVGEYMKRRQVRKKNTGFQHYFCLSSSSSCFSSHLIHLCISLSVLLYSPRSFVSSSPSVLYNCFLNPTRTSYCFSLRNSHLLHHSMHYLLRLHAVLNVPSPPSFFFCFMFSIRFIFHLPLSPALCPLSTGTSRCQTVREGERCRLQAAGAPGSRYKQTGVE